MAVDLREKKEEQHSQQAPRDILSVEFVIRFSLTTGEIKKPAHSLNRGKVKQLGYRSTLHLFVIRLLLFSYVF